MERNPTKNNVRTGQLPKYLGCTVTKYLGERASDVTHKYIITDIIKKRRLRVEDHVSKRYREKASNPKKKGTNKGSQVFEGTSTKKNS